MRRASFRALMIAGLAALGEPALAQTVVAGAPFDISVTVYRDPYRSEGRFDLDNLNGFALITESRRVVLTPGEHTLRFEGVADGIEPASAIVTGLPSGVVEKNRDAALLSPAALVASVQAHGGKVMLTRTDPATGAVTRVEGVLRSDASDGVVFETAEGVEALRCSGLPETFGFQSATTGLSAVPTLSVLTRAAAPVEAVVQLSYLSRGFDWSADYVASMKTGGKLDLGGWVTLANGNGVGFPNARVQVVAGRLNKETDEVEPIDIGQPIIAQCWPQGTTSDIPAPIELAMPMPAPPFAADVVIVTGSRMKSMSENAPSPVAAYTSQEDLGDLKLYRVPDRTAMASRQSKQVRLLDRAGVPVTKLYEVELQANRRTEFAPATILLRTRNDKKNNLGLPLPSGSVSVFETVGTGARAQRLLSGETGLRDLAIDEETELRLSGSPDVQVRQVDEAREVAGAPRPPLPDLPGADRLATRMQSTNLIEISNARPFAIRAEVRLSLAGGQTLVKADRPAEQKNGRPIFRVTVPANGTLQIRYQTASR